MANILFLSFHLYINDCFFFFVFFSQISSSVTQVNQISLLTQTFNLDWRAGSRTGQSQTHTPSLPGRQHHGASCRSAGAGRSVHAGSGAVRPEAAGWSVCCRAPGGEEQDLTLSAAGRPHPAAQWTHSGLNLNLSTLHLH